MSRVVDRSRAPRRNLLLLIGLVPALVLLAFAARIGLVASAQHSGGSAYHAGRYPEAGQEYAQNARLVPFQRWVAAYDEGTARARAEDYPGAVSRLQAALRVVPHAHECRVRENLGTVRKLQGDAAVQSGDAAAAESAYAAGVRAVGGHCDHDLRDLLEASLQAARSAHPRQPATSSRSGDTRQERLRQGNQQAEQSHQDDQQLQDYPSVGGSYQW